MAACFAGFISTAASSVLMHSVAFVRKLLNNSADLYTPSLIHATATGPVLVVRSKSLSTHTSVRRIHEAVRIPFHQTALACTKCLTRTWTLSSRSTMYSTPSELQCCYPYLKPRLPSRWCAITPCSTICQSIFQAESGVDRWAVAPSLTSRAWQTSFSLQR